jgi:serine/threonine protein kinase
VDATDAIPRLSDCPSADELERFLLARLGEPEATRLEQHLLGCDACCRKARDLRAEDAFIADLRQGSAGVPEDVTGPDLERLMGQLEGLWPPPAAEPREERTPGPVAGAAEDTDPAFGAPAGGQLTAELAALADPPHEPGELGRVGPYRLLKRLGAGGMGVVFQARQARPYRLVALKMLRARPGAGRAWLDRFRAEAEVIAGLHHPNIVQVHEVGEHAGWPYFTMEYVDAGSLAQRLASALPPARVAAELVETLARAVHYAHEHGVVHRDLKPSNILMVSGDSPFRETTNPPPPLIPKIADFGLAKQLAVGSDTLPPGCPTETGAVLGTPSYMAPEQAWGKNKLNPVGPAADVYALGAILYELLTGRPPFRGETPLDTLQDVTSREPVPPRQLQPRAPRDLETICLKCLQKEPKKRYAGAAKLADDLGRFLRGEPIRARPVSGWERLRKWARRKPALAALLAVTGLSLAALVAGGLVYNARLQAALRRAQQEQERADTGYRAARDALDRMLKPLQQRRVGEVPQLKELQRQQCEEALAFYRGVLAGADDPDAEVRLDAARAYERAAKIQAVLGRYPGAMRSYRRAIDLLEALPAPQLHRPQTQGVLAACYSDHGFLSRRPAEQRWELGKALAIRERLAREQPDDPERQNALATTEHQLGQIFQKASRLADAERHYRRAAAIRTRLVRDHPRQEGYREALAEQYVNLGLIYAHTGRQGRAIALYEKLETLLRPLIARHPEDVRKALTLAAAEVNWALFLRAKGQRQAALARCTDAVQLAEAALRREPRHFMARGITLNAHGVRAQTNEALGRWADGAKDWGRVIELDEGKGRWVHRALRAMNLAAAGDYTRATAEADALVATGKAVGEGAWGMALVYARSLRAVRSDKRLSWSERDALAERYALRAVALLQRLRKEGYFQDPGRAKALRTDKDLDVLRGRDDFRRLLKSAAGKKAG